jgi:hypothetical protein
LEVDLGAVGEGLIGGCGCCGWRFESPDLRVEIWGTRGVAGLGFCILVEIGLEILSCGAFGFANGFERDAGVDAEAGSGGGVDVEEVGDGGGEGVTVEDAGVAEDVHEKGVGAVGGVELHPLPVFAGSGAAGGGVGFGEAAEPGGVGADGGVGCGVEVAVAAVVVAAEDDCGVAAGGDFVEEIVGTREVLRSGAEVAAEERG